MSMLQCKRWDRASDGLKSPWRAFHHCIRLLTVDALEGGAGYPVRDTQMMCEPFRRRQTEGDSRGLGR